jgi:predicted nucleic acid-binding protein
MALYYADASALVKLVHRERETDALTNFVDGAELVSSELVFGEIPRALRRAHAGDPRLALRPVLRQASELLEAIGLLPLAREILIRAGSLEEPALRTLDAIHVASAITLSPIDAFISYDERQAAVARLAGLPTVAPGS